MGAGFDRCVGWNLLGTRLKWEIIVIFSGKVTSKTTFWQLWREGWEGGGALGLTQGPEPLEGRRGPREGSAQSAPSFPLPPWAADSTPALQG